MTKKQKIRFFLIVLAVLVLILVLLNIFRSTQGHTESIQTAMKDAGIE